MTRYITRLKTYQICVLFTVSIVSCTSTSPVEAERAPEKTILKNNVLEEVSEKDEIKNTLMETTQDPTYAELMLLLASLGYEGVGLQFESQDKLKLLLQVFLNPKAAHRTLRLVYTGSQWNYDLKHQSLTIGEGKDANQTIAFIEKNIKLIPVSLRRPVMKPVQPTPTLSPTPMPTPTALPEEKLSPFQNDVPVASPTPTPEAKPESNLSQL